MVDELSCQSRGIVDLRVVCISLCFWLVGGTPAFPLFGDLLYFPFDISQHPLVGGVIEIDRDYATAVRRLRSWNMLI